MGKDVRMRVIDAVVGAIPSHIKPVNYLSETLDIGKESAYRRLRGKMPFSFEELAILSQELGFSLDELAGTGNSNRIMMDMKVDHSSEQAFLERLKKYRKEVDDRLRDKSSDMVMALNYLPAEFSVHFKDLFKFSYYTWLHRRHKGLSKLHYADVKVLPELEHLRMKLDIDIRDIKSSTFILDPNVFLSPLREVRYFHQLKLINKEEVVVIKKDFHRIIDFVEKMVRTGGANEGTKYYFYLSNFNIDVNSNYSTWDGNIMSAFNFQFFNRITISDPEICKAHRVWLESLKKYSILISESNEVAQAEYFEKQREYIDLL